MDNDKPSEKKAESSTAKPAKKAPAKKAAAKSEKKVSIPPAPTADFPAVTPQPVSDVAPPAPAEAAEAEIVAVDPAPAAPSEMVKESQPVAAGDGEGEFVARHRADDDATQPADPDGATVRADDPSESMTDAEMVQLIQTPMRTPQPSRAPIVIGIVVLLLLRRRRRRRRQRMQAAGR